MNKWKRITEKPYKLDYRKMVKRTFKNPLGKEVSFDLTIGPDVAVVLALTKDNKVILAKQFRPACEKVLMEMPGGAVDKGLTPKQAIEKELLEETGYKGKLEYVNAAWRDAYITGKRYHFIATDCEKVAEPKNTDTEITEVVLMTFPEFIKHLDSGELTDASRGFMLLHFAGLLK